jgi:hypothetical protein
MKGDEPSRCRYLDVRACTLTLERLSDWGGDRDATVANIRLEWSDELELERRAFFIEDANDASDSNHAVPGGRDDLGGRELRFAQGNPPFELRLVLE